MTEILHIADLDFEVRRSARRKTFGLTVDRAGELVVHAPETTDDQQLRKWIGKKLLWVHRKLAEKEDLRPRRRPLEFVTGESIFYLGQSYRLKLVDDQDEPLQFDGEWFTLRRADQTGATAQFRKWFIQAGREWLAERVPALLPKIGGGVAVVDVRDLGFRWGSCGKSGSLHFNWRVLQLPVHLIDYIVAHELVHRLERNHSQRFWQILEEAMPDCKSREAELEREWHCYVAFEVENSGNSCYSNPNLENRSK